MAFPWQDILSGKWVFLRPHFPVQVGRTWVPPAILLFSHWHSGCRLSGQIQSSMHPMQEVPIQYDQRHSRLRVGGRHSVTSMLLGTTAGVCLKLVMAISGWAQEMA